MCALSPKKKLTNATLFMTFQLPCRTSDVTVLALSTLPPMAFLKDKYSNRKPQTHIYLFWRPTS